MTASDETVRPRVPATVFAPEVPQEDRKLLLESPEVMVQASLPKPKPRSDLRKSPTSTIGYLVKFFVADAFFSLLIAGFLDEVLPDGPDTWAAYAVCLLGLLLFLVLVLGSSLSSSESDAASKHHRKYLQPADWDVDAQQMMLRAQDAVQAVTDAEVTRLGLLDDIQNDVVLPEQLWDIGQVLQKLTVLRGRHRELGAETLSVLGDTVARQADALRMTEQAMERKVATLEKYAVQVRSADALLRAERAVEQVQNDDDAYVELLASAEPAAGTALIQDLSEDATGLREQLRQRLDAIRATGQALAPSPEA
ncbi:hypothetical protein E1263_16105 [Kribbella antibiotica]|uniref:Uncharacterized protein n=1 Tax=Kribbella antibiotica TaxID=190195 RepID=A0A4R4ZKU5_9ACTN|nr:hypothetical protein [Kribbella antibiotica]TDD59175.1 hypothetical protein E1263_16105 [Kribbella antibiotica]